jgi:hypothetical protein
MPLSDKQKDEVRERVMKEFGKEKVEQMDHYFMELNDLRMGSETSYAFLQKVDEKYTDQNTALLIGAILFGMRQGELGYEYHLKMQGKIVQDAPKFGKAS